MRIERPIHHDAARVNDFADASARSVEIDLSEGSTSILTARYFLDARSRDDQRPLKIDFSHCPLRPLSIRSDVTKPIDIDAGVAWIDNMIAVSLESDSRASWHGAELTISFQWNHEPLHASLVNSSYLYLPEELPSLGAHHTPLSEACDQLPVTIVPTAQRFVAGAVPYATREVAHLGGPFLQVVLTRESRIECIAGDGKSAKVSAIMARSAEPTRVMEVCGSIQEISEFFGQRLHSIPGLRLAAAPDSVEGAKAMAGALLTAPLSWYPSRTDEQRGHPFPIARMVAENWWGVGCRIHGAHGIFLTGGIAFAMGLQWAEANTPRSYFAPLLESYRERLVKKSVFARTEPKPGERTVGIGLVIFEGLNARRSMWQCLGLLTSSYWSRSAPEQVVLKALVASGVDVRDFRRKRFVRQP